MNVSSQGKRHARLREAAALGAPPAAPAAPSLGPAEGAVAARNASSEANVLRAAADDTATAAGATKALHHMINAKSTSGMRKSTVGRDEPGSFDRRLRRRLGLCIV